LREKKRADRRAQRATRRATQSAALEKRRAADSERRAKRAQLRATRRQARAAARARRLFAGKTKTVAQDQDDTSVTAYTSEPDEAAPVRVAPKPAAAPAVAKTPASPAPQPGPTQTVASPLAAPDQPISPNLVQTVRVTVAPRPDGPEVSAAAMTPPAPAQAVAAVPENVGSNTIVASAPAVSPEAATPTQKAETSFMRVMFLAFAGLLTVGTAVRLAMG
jgi:hypothetical protein